MASLITEHVTPLDVAVENQENDEIYTGLYNILEALNFLHESVGLNNFFVVYSIIGVMEIA